MPQEVCCSMFSTLITQVPYASLIMLLRTLISGGQIYGQFWEMFKYYKRNLRRFTTLVMKGEFNKLLRPGRFSTERPNNLELILKLTDAHLGGIVNSTKNT